MPWTPTNIHNPRLEAWLHVHGLSHADIQRENVYGDPRMVEVNGERNVWTVHFSAWITSKRRAWAHGLGFKSGPMPHREAMRAGHTDDEFDAWLFASVDAERALYKAEEEAKKPTT